MDVPIKGRWVGDVDLETQSTFNTRDFGYHPLLVGTAVSEATTRLVEEDAELGRHYRHTFTLRVPDAPVRPDPAVEYTISAHQFEDEPTPAWVHYVKSGSVVEVLFGYMAKIPQGELGRLVPDPVPSCPRAVRVFVPMDEEGTRR